MLNVEHNIVDVVSANINNFIATHLDAGIDLEPELFAFEALNAGYEAVVNRYMRSLSIPVSLTSRNAKVPAHIFAYNPIVLGYHARARASIREFERIANNNRRGVYGPAISNLTNNVKASNEKFLSGYRNLFLDASDIASLDFASNQRLNSLLEQYTSDPSPVLKQREANAHITYPLLTQNKLRAAANQSLELQKQYVRDLLVSSVSRETLTFVTEIQKAFETSIKTEQFVRNVAASVVRFVGKIVSMIMSGLWRILRPIVSALWTLIGPTLPVLERITAVAVRVTEPLRQLWRFVNIIPGFAYMRYGILIGLPIASSLLGLAGYTGLSEIVNTFKESVPKLLAGVGEAVDMSVQQYVNQYSSGILGQVLSSIVGPAISSGISFFFGSYLPFLFGFGATSFVYVLIILLLPIIHKGIVFLRQVEEARKALSDLIIEDMEAEQKRVRQATMLSRT